MTWSDLYQKDHKPSEVDTSDFINHELWQELNDYIQDTYQVQPVMDYSGCSMQKGWNITRLNKHLCKWK